MSNPIYHILYIVDTPRYLSGYLIGQQVLPVDPLITTRADMIDMDCLMLPTDITNPDELLTGDVVQDRSNNKPMQIVGRDLRSPDQVDQIWENTMNRKMFGLTEDDTVYECVYLPTGSRLAIPNEKHLFPGCRLERVQAEHPTEYGRVQAEMMKSVLACVTAQMRNDGYDTVADAVIAELRTMLPDNYVDAVNELSEAANTTDDVE